MIVVSFRSIPLLIAAFALVISASAACACSHHDASAKDDPLSCHSKTHDGPRSVSVSQVPSGDSAGGQCECYVRAFTPATTAKNESKRFKTVGSDPVDKAPNALIQAGLTAFAEITSVSFELVTIRTRTLARSGHSRAPPRL